MPMYPFELMKCMGFNLNRAALGLGCFVITVAGFPAASYVLDDLNLTKCPTLLYLLLVLSLAGH